MRKCDYKFTSNCIVNIHNLLKKSHSFIYDSEVPWLLQLVLTQTYSEFNDRRTHGSLHCKFQELYMILKFSLGIYFFKKLYCQHSQLGLFKGDFLNQTRGQINHLRSVLQRIKVQIKYLDSGLEFFQIKGHIKDPGSNLIQIKV